jgi:peptidoglycan/LPS O-acetylase OafA/YrhL
LDARKPLLGALTGVRTPFALLVVYNHVIILFLGASQSVGDAGPAFMEWAIAGYRIFDTWALRGLAQGACVGLSLFFTLSGFILTYVYDPGPENRPLDKRDFFIARVARIYPLYFLALIITFPIFYLIHVQNLPVYKSVAMGLSTIFLVQSWWPSASIVWNPPGWSLSTEAFFYVTFPFFVRCFHNWKRWQLLAMVPLLWLLSMIVPLWYHWTLPDGTMAIDWALETRADSVTWFKFVKHFPVIRLPEFVVGIVLGKLYLLDLKEGTHDRKVYGAMLSVGSMLAIIAIMLMSESIYYLMLHNGFTSPLFFILLYGLALGGGPLAELFARPRGVLLGDSTYAMYILHTAVIAYSIVPVAEGLKKGDDVMSPMAFFIFVLVVTILISLWVYRKFEIPWRRRVRKYFEIRPPA